MWMGKIRHGVLAVYTDSGIRYLKPSLAGRLMLLWIFRHFAVLPEQVLGRYQRKLVTRMLAQGKFVAPSLVYGEGDCRIGMLEKSTPLPARKPARTIAAAGTVLSQARESNPTT